MEPKENALALWRWWKQIMSLLNVRRWEKQNQRLLDKIMSLQHPIKYCTRTHLSIFSFIIRSSRSLTTMPITQIYNPKKKNVSLQTGNESKSKTTAFRRNGRENDGKTKKRHTKFTNSIELWAIDDGRRKIVQQIEMEWKEKQQDRAWCTWIRRESEREIKYNHKYSNNNEPFQMIQSYW